MIVRVNVVLNRTDGLLENLKFIPESPYKTPSSTLVGKGVKWYKNLKCVKLRFNRKVAVIHAVNSQFISVYIIGLFFLFFWSSSLCVIVFLFLGDSFCSYSINPSLRTADPVVASLPPTKNIYMYIGGREATTGNTSAVLRLHKSDI